ncbi:hypothetical protein F4802DRAFT_592911 [Xylaria palmicola]|nr:hypothetical protein F4802DRAFT_592911 [Xylaria palmicola]
MSSACNSTYQQLHTVPATLGAEVSLWRLRAEDGYVPDVAELEKLIKANTKVYDRDQQPEQPSRRHDPRSVLEGIIQVARERGIIVFSDEGVTGPSSTSCPAPRSRCPRRRHRLQMSKAWGAGGVRIAARRNQVGAVTRFAPAVAPGGPRSRCANNGEGSSAGTSSTKTAGIFLVPGARCFGGGGRDFRGIRYVRVWYCERDRRPAGAPGLVTRQRILS